MAKDAKGDEKMLNNSLKETKKEQKAEAKSAKVRCLWRLGGERVLIHL